MPSQAQAYRWMPWAWSLAWLLTGMGGAISDIYSSPSKSLSPYVILSILGWSMVGFVTAKATRQVQSTAIQSIAWLVASMVASLLSLAWLHSWNIGFLGPIAACGLAGAIGGAASPVRPRVGRLVSAVLLGSVFALFATVSFYLSFIFLSFFRPMARLFGNGGASVLAWGLPGALCGLVTGFLARQILGVREAIVGGANSR
jgi:hypothetical protein